MAGMSGARVLVTGGVGFIGSHICDALLSAGASVVCFDNLSSGSSDNITHLSDELGFELVVGDIRDAAACLSATRGCTHVSHQAAMCSVPLSIEQPDECSAINIKGTLNIFNAALECGIGRVVYASSAACYGDDAAEVKFENRIGNLLSPYAESKYQMELDASHSHVAGGTEFFGLRYFNVYGSRQNPTGAYASVIPAFISKLKRGQAPLIFGDGEQTRDFVHVKDAARANLLALCSESSDSSRICNIASGESISINELFRHIRRLAAEHDPAIANMEKRHAEERIGEIKHSLASVERAMVELGFSCSVSIEEGLSETVTWYVQNAG